MRWVAVGVRSPITGLTLGAGGTTLGGGRGGVGAAAASAWRCGRVADGMCGVVVRWLDGWGGLGVPGTAVRCVVTVQALADVAGDCAAGDNFGCCHGGSAFCDHCPPRGR